MKAKTIMKGVKLGSLTLVLLVCTLSGNAQKKEVVIDSLSKAFSEVFNWPFTLDPNMALGCQNSAKESYDGNVIPPVKGQAHYHARLKMEDDKVLDILRLETIISNFLELVERADSKAYLNEIGANRFWVEEVQVANVHYLVVGID